MDAVSSASARSPRWQGQASLIAERFARLGDRQLPLYLQLESAIAELIEAGELKSGLQMPPEQSLATILGISLGTVQKGLQTLNRRGLIVRKHGRGTFVAPPRQSLTELRHFRFLDPRTDTQLPVYTRLLVREAVDGDADTVRRLGAGTGSFLRIVRLIDVDGRFCCHSEMYLPADRFEALLSVPVRELERLNLKQVFADRLGIVTDRVVQSVRLCELAPEVCELLAVERGTGGMLLQATGFSRGDTAISYQRILIPPSPCPLDVSPQLDGA